MNAQKDQKTLGKHYFVNLANRDAVTVRMAPDGT